MASKPAATASAIAAAICIPKPRSRAPLASTSLLLRAQPPNIAFSSDIIHPDQAGISKSNLQQKLATLYKAAPEQVSVFGLRTAFGGGKTTAFACIYDSVEARKKFDAKHRLVRNGLATKPERASRQQRKQRKNRMKTLRGTEKTKGKKAKKDS
ncbi:ribosomal protein S24e-domain-containing protein [Xylaria telfairii]|nr:ribosomal protein S24e-domain-containing protein [Xylaria telfairii]